MLRRTGFFSPGRNPGTDRGRGKPLPCGEGWAARGLASLLGGIAVSRCQWQKKRSRNFRSGRKNGASERANIFPGTARRTVSPGVSRKPGEVGSSKTRERIATPVTRSLVRNDSFGASARDGAKPPLPKGGCPSSQTGAGGYVHRTPSQERNPPVMASRGIGHASLRPRSQSKIAPRFGYKRAPGTFA